VLPFSSSMRIVNIRRFTQIIFVTIILGIGSLSLIQASLAEELQLPSELSLLPLEQVLTDLQRQWQTNTRNHAREQALLHRQADRLRATLCTTGKAEFCLTKPQALQAKNVDIRKLAYAVAVAETKDCTTGMGVSKNNCHGIFGCVEGKCGPREFASKEDSYLEFQRLWLEKYGDRFPTLADAKKYTYSPGKTWLKTVRLVYDKK